METRKTAVACFIGGALTMAAALALTPEYWWFGLIAGIAGGYISYEFREVLKAIPVALRAAMSWRPQRQYWTAVGWAALVYLGIAAWLATVLWVIIFPLSTPPLDQSSVILYGVLVAYGALIILSSLLNVMIPKEGSGDYTSYTKIFRSINYYISPPIVLFWHLPRGIWRLPRLIMFLGRFAWHLFRLIHSQKRVLCAIDGTLGGAVSYIWLVPPSATSAEQALLVICGGLLGSAFGVANHEIVSKRILHLPATETVRA